jgi:hypothetical protein
MPPDSLVWLALLTFGVLLIVLGSHLLRRIGAHVGMGRRLGGATEWSVGDLAAADRLPMRPVRVTGRIRCAEPLQLPPGDRLVAYHRDIEVRFGSNRWRTIERIRETRSFELWDHDGSLTVDPAAAAEPLVVVPHVWNGQPDELAEVHRRSITRLTASEGEPTAARATTRTVPVVERLLVLAQPAKVDGSVRLTPPRGGYVISTVALNDAMRLLAGGNRRGLAIGLGLVAAGSLAAAAGLVGLIVGALG